jgi:Zn finger protein HypA/HybF involved in hydrogenase expression
MTCPKCNSSNVNVNVINEVKLKNQHHGIIWWICVGWWWIPIKWICLTLPALLAKIFIPKKQKAINIQKTMCVCQDCGNSWQI